MAQLDDTIIKGDCNILGNVYAENLAWGKGGSLQHNVIKNSTVAASGTLNLGVTYTVGKNNLLVYLNGEKLIVGEQGTAAGDCHATEVGTSGSSTQIKLSSDWSIATEDVVEVYVLPWGAGGVAKSDLLDMIYPVGSIYMSWNNVSPSLFIGGTWSRLSGGFLYGCNDSPSTGDLITGVPRTSGHVLTENEIPAHTHDSKIHIQDIGDSYVGGGAAGTGSGIYEISGGAAVARGAGSSKTQTSSTGKDQSHTHNMPYIAVYIWRRTA